MMILLVAVIGLAIAAALALWPAPNARSPEGGRGFRGVLHSEPGTGAPEPVDRRPSSLEGVLVDQLIKGDISRRQYLRALENIAARDEERHPLSLPRDDLPGACT